MIASLLRVLAFMLILIIVAMIETTVAAPVVAMTLFLLFSRSFQPIVFFLFTSIVSLLFASVLMQSWLLIFMVMVIGSILFRSDLSGVQTSFIKSLGLVIVMGSIISVFSAPVVSTAYVFHSLFSIFIASVICYKVFSLKEKKLRWKEIRFGGEQ